MGDASWPWTPQWCHHCTGTPPTEEGQTSRMVWHCGRPGGAKKGRIPSCAKGNGRARLVVIAGEGGRHRTWATRKKPAPDLLSARHIRRNLAEDLSVGSREFAAARNILAWSWALMRSETKPLAPSSWCMCRGQAQPQQSFATWHLQRDTWRSCRHCQPRPVGTFSQRDVICTHRLPYTCHCALRRQGTSDPCCFRPK